MVIMTEQYLMKKTSGGSPMNVPIAKLEEYLAKGWEVVKKPQDNRYVVVTDQPVAEDPPVAVETAPVKDVEAAVAKIEKKSKGKGKK